MEGGERPPPRPLSRPPSVCWPRMGCSRHRETRNVTGTFAAHGPPSLPAGPGRRDSSGLELLWVAPETGEGSFSPTNLFPFAPHGATAFPRGPQRAGCLLALTATGTAQGPHPAPGSRSQNWASCHFKREALGAAHTSPGAERSRAEPVLGLPPCLPGPRG